MALLRVKRKTHEDPIDSLLLACKKQKTEDPPFSTVFKFAGTVEEKDKDLDTHVNNAKEAYNTDKNSLYKKRQVSDITDKLRAENKLFSQNNRLKVINCFRHGESGGADKELTVVDIENQPQEITNEVPKDSHSSEVEPMSTKEQYVYDLYYSSEGDFDDLMMENMLSAHAVDETLFDFSGQDDDNEEVRMIEEDEDDSNDENNWRNDYPDEVSEDSSIEESDLRLAMQMKNVNIDGEYESDLSSDREDEALVYGDDYHRGHYYCPSYSENSSSDED